MIKTIDVLNKLNEEDKEKYGEMIKSVNIPDFYKCMAQFSGIAISKLDGDTIASYLITWARNKFRFYKMLGNQTRLDTHFVYVNECVNYKDQYKEIMKKFPVYALWLDGFASHKTNDIDMRNLDYGIRFVMSDLFPRFQADKSTITHFFKSQLNAPDELVTEIGKIYENKEIEATHTLSIDPVDIMLASENPYEWNSCYRLELDRTDSHADGCMATVLDTTGLISYVWSSHGEYNMYDNFKFKDIRYYRIRQWVNVEPEWKAIHFASAYPNRNGYDGKLNEQLRAVVEEVVAKAAGTVNKWRKGDCDEVQIEREIQYGYNEFEEDYCWVNSELVPRDIMGDHPNNIYIPVYNTAILCACGCGQTLKGSDEVTCEDEAYDGDLCYNGNGFCAENVYEYEEEYDPEPLWCQWCDSDCEQGLYEEDCCEREDCPIWREHHKPCSLDKDIMCDRADEVSTYEEKGKEICHANCADCEGCWHWMNRKKEEEDKKEED